ncbi:T9SS type A sorting domain-containing protein [Aquimarina sp. AU474]|uniref:T9SS type A sorting domain-containing protein n=1 Tax=Aquimarina sp. AU474 TaxID=2108529 RepID=UPI000D68C1DF|nr:T9SS type A sorting domain-containing protein [Aquimarina sp. AU474]
MKTILFYLKRSVWALVMLGTIAFTNAQQFGLQSQAKPSEKKQTLKNQQVFTSDGGSIDYRNIMLKREDAIKRAEFEFERTKDPSGKIPFGIRQAEIEFSSKIAVGDDSQKALQTASKSGKRARFSYWRNRGPGNVGGRTRALAVDRTNENVILAGGVSGGLWRSRNGGSTWRNVTRRFQNPSVTAIVQDPRPGRGFTWYYSSGERVGSGISAGGAFFQGNGIYKSQDGGRTWEQLNATINQNIGAFDSAFDLINDLVINPINGDLFVATFNGLFRSQDGGNSFNEVLETGFDSFVEVSITSTGILYASTSSNGAPNTGFLTSNDNGETWTNITPPNFIAAYGRSKIGVDHSNEDVVYFFTQDRDPNNQAVLYRYDASGATPEETWVNLTANLPFSIPINFGIGDLNLQGGYNMVMEVHPTQSNIVFVGGTCLYRSTTGFTTPAGVESWIGGNGPGELDVLLNTIGRGASYTNQHADQHALVFFPSNPNKAVTGHDGGLSLTEDITVVNDQAEQVTWTSLNNNYVTTHPYHVAFNPQSEDENLLAGFQDNGSWFTNSTNPSDDWIEQLGADGGYNAIADNGSTHYVSVQNGIIRRLNLDEEGNRVSFATVHPAGASGFAFINPFILDPIHDNVMYVSAGNTIWRNNNLDEIPLSSNAPTPVNWVNLETSATPAGSRITALDLSKFPVANRLYYGTNTGQVFRMDNANVDNQTAVDITTGKGLPTGFVNDINVDPSNSDRVILTFSNYGIPSVFITDDAGETWTNISGNLEENPDGSGNGPSVRSTAFFGSSQGFFGARLQRIFAATSTGLYYTTRLNGQNTVWRKENVRIGNAVTDEVAVRKDGFIAIASGGRGMFSARFPVLNKLPEPTLSVAFPLDDFGVDENSEDTEIDITGLFVQSQGRPINVEITNSNPELVTVTLVNNTLTLSYTSDSIGDASIGLIATSGEEQVSEGFTVNVSEPSIYEQINPLVSTIPSQNFLDFGAIVQSADDFVVPEGNTWDINRVLAFGTVRGNPAFNSVNVVIYNDNNGVPGDEVYNSGELAPTSELNDSNLNLTLPEAVRLESGNYWISVYVNLAFNPGTNQWFWASQDNSIGNETQFIDPVNLFGFGAVDWTTASVPFQRVPLDQRFQIFGDVTGSDADEAEGETELASIDAFGTAAVYPNPSEGEFIFNFGDKLSKSGGKTSVRIFSSTGRLIQVNSDINLSNAFVWDASNLAPGFYFAKFSGGMTGVFKLAKQ